MEFERKEGLGASHITVQEVAAYLNGSEQWVRNLIEDGQLEAFRIAGKRYIRLTSLQRLLAESQATPIGDEELREQLRRRRRKEAQEKQGAHAVQQLELLDEE